MEESLSRPVLDPVVTSETPSPSIVPACEPVDATLGAGDLLPAGSSAYRLAMFRGDANSRPAWAAGTLLLEPRPAELRRMNDWSVPLQGTSDIDVARIGAHDTGALDSDDPRAPGVLVLQSDAENMILLRLGPQPIARTKRPSTARSRFSRSGRWTRKGSGAAGGVAASATRCEGTSVRRRSRCSGATTHGSP